MRAGAAPGRIGPNAITRVDEALVMIAGAAVCDAVFADAGLTSYRQAPPVTMVPDDEVARLHAALFARLGIGAGRMIGAEAGRRTGAYLLAHRIPRIARLLLPLLPSRLALSLLLRAIQNHAWTFAGSGLFSWRAIPSGFELVLENNPVSRDVRAAEPVCDFYRATFETLFRALAGSSIRVEEIACAAGNDTRCVFLVRV